MLKIDNVSFSYNKSKTVLSRLCFSIAAGESVVFLGHNGAGKTTLIKLIIGLLAPDSGTIALRSTPSRPRIGYVPDVGGFYSNLSIKDNLNIVLQLMAGIDQRVQTDPENMFERMGLKDMMLQQAGTLSLGQQKRLSLALALATSPELIILDEPTSGLDPISTEAIVEILQKLRRESGITIIFSSHDLVSAAVCCQRYIFLSDGKIIDDGDVGGDYQTLKMNYFHVAR